MRRKLLATGAAATAIAAVGNAFGQQGEGGGGGRQAPQEDVSKMKFYEKGNVKIHYEEWGSGFPILLIAGGGLSSVITGLRNPFHIVDELQGEYRCISSDLRNAAAGHSVGPLDVDHPWDAYAQDQIGVMDHLGIDKFAVLGCCIGGPMVWNVVKHAGSRVVAAVPCQPSGYRPELPTFNYDQNMAAWGPDLVKRRPEITMDQVQKFLFNMYGDKPDFVYTVTREFVKNCQTPVMIMPDDVPPHPYAVALECAKLAPKSEMTMYPWATKDLMPIALRQLHTFLKLHTSMA